jgi:ADP-ribosyl-[dinitrogen reductase] hydrolase
MAQSTAAISLADRFRGCLLGGACGDALGGAVEFDSTAAIQRRFGPGGIHEMVEAYGRVGAITDDTQMTLWTAEGLLRAEVRWREKGICHPPSIVAMAYARWMLTQGEQPGFALHYTGWQPDGWLFGVKALHSRRAPGNTCIAGLRRARMGTIDEPANQSKGCGGVMRVAPVGLYVKEPFRLGAEIAAITHGHPSGYLAAGFLAALISRVAHGEQLDRAIRATKEELRGWQGHAETLAAVEAAERLAETQPQPTPAAIETLGGGWTGEEALAIALYCALTAASFEASIVAAVNHSGDSDSTGSICGNILGALWGIAVVPPRWLETLELRETIERIARDLLPPEEGGPDELRLEDYPGY